MKLYPIHLHISYHKVVEMPTWSSDWKRVFMIIFINIITIIIFIDIVIINYCYHYYYYYYYYYYLHI
jgi:hypothetical protein